MWQSVHSRLAMGPTCLLRIEETPQCRSCFGLGAEALLDSCAKWFMGSDPFQKGSEQTSEAIDEKVSASHGTSQILADVHRDC